MHIPTEKEKENEPKSNFSFVFRLVSLQNVKRKQEGARDETGERKKEQKKTSSSSLSFFQTVLESV